MKLNSFCVQYSQIPKYTRKEMWFSPKKRKKIDRIAASGCMLVKSGTSDRLSLSSSFSLLFPIDYQLLVCPILLLLLLFPLSNSKTNISGVVKTWLTSLNCEEKEASREVEKEKSESLLAFLN